MQFPILSEHFSRFRDTDVCVVNFVFRAFFEEPGEDGDFVFDGDGLQGFD